MKPRVVITGLGIVAPNAFGAEDFEAGLRAGRSGLSARPEMRELGFECQVAGVPEDLDVRCQAELRPDYKRTTNAALRYGLLAALDCWRDAGLERPEGKSEGVDVRTGAIVGSCIAGTDTLATVVAPALASKSIRRLGSAIIEQIMGNGPVAKIADYLALGGRTSSNSSACSTGAEALLEAYHEIVAGRAERMLAGGVEAPSVALWAGFDAMRVLARGYNDRPHEASRPLSATASGFVPAAGAGVLLLERLDAALARNAKIYAEFMGGHVNCGGFRNGGTMTAPSSAGVQRCIRAAAEATGVDLAEIDVISGHLTGTFADPLEIANWKAVRGELPYVNAPKALLGHTLGAAGALESAAVAIQLRSGFIHGSPTSSDLHPALADLRERIPLATVETRPKLIAKTAFGFGDVNACLFFRAYE